MDCRLVVWTNTYSAPERGRRTDCRINAYSNTYTSVLGPPATKARDKPHDRRNAGKPWTDNEVARLRNLSFGATPVRLIVRELGRPEEELRVKAEELGLAIDPART